jgi:hypothetical protein
MSSRAVGKKRTTTAAALPKEKRERRRHRRRRKVVVASSSSSFSCFLFSFFFPIITFEVVFWSHIFPDFTPPLTP